MRRTPFRLALAAAGLLLGAPLAQAQIAPPKPAQPAAAQPDAAFEAQKMAFLALPAATRVAAQDALVWLGLYNGTSDGDFGKRTRDAIVAFQTGQKAPGDGVLSPAQLQTLLTAGDKARAAVGFRTIADPKTGARIGAPLKLLGARSRVTLDFASDPGGDLAALYGRLAAETPDRKVAYKAIKAGAFFVVTGQDAGRTFYTRYELNPAATPPIRGFTFSYPVARGDLFRVALAVADAFVAFPPPGPATTSNADAAQTPLAQPPEPKATALIVARDRALTALKPGDCPNPSVGGKPARFERTDPATGLRAPLRRLRRGAGAPARSARPRPRRTQRGRRARRGDPRGASRRRASYGRRLARPERGGRPRVRPAGRARRAGRAHRGGAEAGRRSRACGSARPDRRRGHRRLPRRRRAHADRGAGPPQRRRDR